MVPHSGGETLFLPFNLLGDELMVRNEYEERLGGGGGGVSGTDDSCMKPAVIVSRSTWSAPRLLISGPKPTLPPFISFNIPRKRSPFTFSISSLELLQRAL